MGSLNRLSVGVFLIKATEMKRVFQRLIGGFASVQEATLVAPPQFLHTRDKRLRSHSTASHRAPRRHRALSVTHERTQLTRV